MLHERIALCMLPISLRVVGVMRIGLEGKFVEVKRRMTNA